MRTLIVAAVAALLPSFVVGCAADLRVTQVNVEWSDSQRRVTSTIENAGSASADSFMVYVTPLECPESQNFRPQARHEVAALAAGESVTFVDDFAPQARNENSNLGNVYGVEVRADPKSQVAEANESNNTGGASPHNPDGIWGTQFNEGLATVLRGVIIDAHAAQQLEIPTGYFRIREFRVAGQPAKSCITLSIVKPYAESFAGASVLPRSEEPWVFSDIELDTHTSAGKRFVGRDSFGHELSFDITFGASCVTVNSASINCVQVQLSTQTFTTSVLNTCNMTTEPAFSAPSGQ